MDGWLRVQIPVAIANDVEDDGIKADESLSGGPLIEAAIQVSTLGANGVTMLIAAGAVARFVKKFLGSLKARAPEASSITVVVADDGPMEVVLDTAAEARLIAIIEARRDDGQ